MNTWITKENKNMWLDENIDAESLMRLLWYMDEMSVSLDLFDKEGNPTPYKKAWDRMAHIVLIPEMNNDNKQHIKERVELKKANFQEYWNTLNLNP